MRSTTAKSLVVGTPFEPLVRRMVYMFRPRDWTSPTHWERRYQRGGTSGAGSYGRLAEFKAEVLNGFVAARDISTIIEFGCGDGNQLKLAAYPQYTGVDVSETAIARCREIFRGDPSKRFLTLSEHSGQTAELALSLDVIFHLVEDDIFDAHMNRLFDSAERFVVIYSSNREEQPPEYHVRHRRFTAWIARHRPDASLVEHVPNRFPFDKADPDNTSFADFYIYAT
jgi:SAM-dependent methyltransferase